MYFPGEPYVTDVPEGKSFSAICRVLWHYKLTIAASTCVCALIAVVIALTATQYYRGETVVVPARSGNMGGQSGLESGLGGLAALGLLSSDSETDTAEAVLGSHNIVEVFIRRYGLLPELNKGAKKPLTMWYAVKAFQERILTIKKDSRKGTTIVAIEWTNPQTAARWANDFVALANELMRKHAMDESNRNIQYLNAQLTKTDTVEIRRAIFNIIETETRSAMLANGRIEYAFQVVDQATPAEMRVRPRRTLMVIAGSILGFALASIFALVRDSMRRSAGVTAG
jgi:uncharacterized protein involved in exopolysaccharide biosynthesis